MSSHHFVRDKQEAALIIANGESCSPELLNQLLEWNPFILVLDGAWSRVVELQIKPDAVLGDFDSIPENHPGFLEYDTLKIIHTPDQEFTDLQKGIQYLAEEGHRAANIVWATGRRADHNFNNLATLPQFAGIIDLAVVDDFSRVYNLPKTFKKWYPKNTKISLLPIGVADGIHTKNLAFNLQGESLQLPGRTGSSNFVTEDGFVEIEYSGGHLLIMECWDR
ncbi:MAG: thiamine diphosphokinase [Bacteroidetes bacterium]|nr:thiamine diphosphokinase [Bacteroidota bacterium]